MRSTGGLAIAKQMRYENWIYETFLLCSFCRVGLRTLQNLVDLLLPHPVFNHHWWRRNIEIGQTTIFVFLSTKSVVVIQQQLLNIFSDLWSDLCSLAQLHIHALCLWITAYSIYLLLFKTIHGKVRHSHISLSLTMDAHTLCWLGAFTHTDRAKDAP